MTIKNSIIRIIASYLLKYSVIFSFSSTNTGLYVIDIFFCPFSFFFYKKVRIFEKKDEKKKKKKEEKEEKKRKKRKKRK